MVRTSLTPSSEGGQPARVSTSPSRCETSAHRGGQRFSTRQIRPTLIPSSKKDYHGFYEFTFRRFFDDGGHPLRTGHQRVYATSDDVNTNAAATAAGAGASAAGEPQPNAQPDPVYV